MHYQLSYHSPHKQLIYIRFEINISQKETIELHIPAWRPGKYELQHYAKNIINFRAVDDKNNLLAWEKTNRNTWQIKNVNRNIAIVTYAYFASQMDAGGSWLDEFQFYINPINCLMYVKELENEVHTVEIDLPDHYRIASGLPFSGRNTLVANSYLHLADSPIIASKILQNHTFEIHKIPITISILGECEPNWQIVEHDFAHFIQLQIDLFGSFPEKDYHFLIFILPYPYFHGVEHRNSTVMTLGPDVDFHAPSFYNRLLGLACHEFFHTWNICKIRPKEMLPYNLSKENYFPTGFVAEGVTTYYGDLILLKSGVWNTQSYFEELNDCINMHFSNSARHTVSLVQSSIDLWVDGYQKTHPNRKVSIYDKGAIVALILDLEIRKLSQNLKSLDDAMQLIWQRFGQAATGYTINDYKSIAQEMAGDSLEKYFDDCIFGTLPLERIVAKSLDYIGCVLNISHPEDILAQKFGLKLRKEFGKWAIDALAQSSPADKQLSEKDEIISVNQLVDPKDWQKLHDKQMISISINRAGRKLTKNLISDSGSYFPVYAVKQNKNATVAQKENFSLWSRAYNRNGVIAQ